MLEKLSSRKLILTLLTIVGAVIAEDQGRDKVTSAIVAIVACTYVVAQALVDAKAVKVVTAVKEGIDRAND
jgi:hypothetical protein